MNTSSLASPLHNDPLAAAIAEFHVFGQNLSDLPTPDETEQLSEAFYTLLNWTAPATSLDGALAALRLARREMKMGSREDGLADVMLEAAMAYLDAADPHVLQRSLTRRSALYLTQ